MASFALDAEQATALAQLLRLAFDLTRAAVAAHLIAITEPQFPAQQDDWMYFDVRGRVPVEVLRDTFAFRAAEIEGARVLAPPALEVRVRVLKSDRALPPHYWPLRVRRAGTFEIPYGEFAPRYETLATPGPWLAGADLQPVTLRDAPNRLVREDVVLLRSEFGYSYATRGAIFDDASQGINLIAERPAAPLPERAPEPFAALAFLDFEPQHAAETTAALRGAAERLRATVHSDADLRAVLDQILRQPTGAIPGQ